MIRGTAIVGAAAVCGTRSYRRAEARSGFRGRSEQSFSPGASKLVAEPCPAHTGGVSTGCENRPVHVVLAVADHHGVRGIERGEWLQHVLDRFRFSAWGDHRARCRRWLRELTCGQSEVLEMRSAYTRGFEVRVKAARRGHGTAVEVLGDPVIDGVLEHTGCCEALTIRSDRCRRRWRIGFHRQRLCQTTRSTCGPM